MLGEKRTRCINAWDFKRRWSKDVNDDYMVVKQLYSVLKTADAVVTHNGKRFDWKFLQTRLMHHGFLPLHSIPHLDTCNEAKKYLYLFNNRLNTLGEFLVGKKKKDTGGWELWVDVYERKAKAMHKMTEYCKQDVRLTEQVFLKMRPLIKGIPHAAIFANDSISAYCPRCGSVKTSKHGVVMQRNGTFQKYKCKNCGSVAKGEQLTKVKPRLQVF